jgi:hypothetical protein
MSAEDTNADELASRWFATLRIDLDGPHAAATRGVSRRLSRALSDEELAALSERLRATAEQFLAAAGALDEEAGEGWAEALANGSWAWQIEER